MLTRSEVTERAKQIRLLVLDVDGVMTDGTLSFTAQGDEIKAFNILDGQGIKQLMRSGIDVAIITGRTSPLVARRARDLGINHLVQGREDKLSALKDMLTELGLTLPQVAYMGDDLPDISAIRAVGLGATVPNAYPLMKKHAHWCASLGGGAGAIREFADVILEAQDKLADIHQAFFDVQ